MILRWPLADAWKMIIHWQYRADQARGVATEMHDPSCREVLLAIAEEYEQLAQSYSARLSDESAEVHQVEVG